MNKSWHRWDTLTINEDGSYREMIVTDTVIVLKKQQADKNYYWLYKGDWYFMINNDVSDLSEIAFQQTYYDISHQNQTSVFYEYTHPGFSDVFLIKSLTNNELIFDLNSITNNPFQESYKKTEGELIYEKLK